MVFDHPWIYVVLLGLLCMVISFIAPKSSASGSKTLVKEMEDTMEQFAAEIADENEQLLQSVVQIKNEHKQQIEQLSVKIEQLERHNYVLSQDIKNMALLKLQPQLQADTPANTIAANGTIAAETASEAHDSVQMQMQMKARYPDLFRLHEQGKSVEYIAKKLNLNKGEVLLIIQLAKQEELNRVSK